MAPILKPNLDADKGGLPRCQHVLADGRRRSSADTEARPRQCRRAAKLGTEFCDQHQADAATTDEAKVSFVLHDGPHGFLEYDVTGLPNVHRVCIGQRMTKGDIFNVYCSDGVKLGGTWLGDLTRSMAWFASSHLQFLARFRGPDAVARCPTATATVTRND